MKRLYVFDMDNTLTESRTPIDEPTAGLLCELLKSSHVAVISGAAFWQFELQLLNGIPCKDRLAALTLLPTSGAEMWQYDGSWKKVYSHAIPEDVRQKVVSLVADIASIQKGHEAEYIEDRGSGVTYSALGIKAPLEKKNPWDPDQKKRQAMVSRLAPLLPELSIRIGGTTSIDFTLEGIDKAFGVRELARRLKIELSDVVFVGDALYPGGNDEAVNSLGIRTVPTAGPRETQGILRKFIDENRE